MKKWLMVYEREQKNKLINKKNNNKFLEKAKQGVAIMGCTQHHLEIEILADHRYFWI